MRERGTLALAFLVMIIATAEPAHADTVPSPEETGEVVDQPALPAGPIPSIEPSVPEGDFEPAPTEPVPTAYPTEVPPAPLGTATFDPTRPSGTVVETFRSGDASTSRGTGGEAPRGTAPAPQGTEPEQERTQTLSASPTPTVPTAAPSPVVATASPAPGDARGDSAGSGTAVRSISAPKAPAPTVPTLLLGMAVLVAGLLLMRYRAPVYHAVVSAGNRRIATSSGEHVERLQGPFRLGVAGAIVVLVGIVMNGYAGWQLFSALAS